MQPRNGKTIFAFCGPSQNEELGGQMAADVLEAHGFAVTFAGGGMAGDEILAQIQENRPSVLLMFASAAGDLPAIRSVIDRLREIGACPHTQIAVGGGVFNRAEGLAEEMGADLWATDPLDLAELLISQSSMRASANQRSVGKKRAVVGKIGGDTGLRSKAA
jgi:MerR family transcriptional regulator, light-induced transcriptional regulator